MAKWGGSYTRKARAAIEPLLPLPCWRCGLPVYPDQRWHVGHLVDRALGGTNDPTNLAPEHGRCSESAGGRLGHQLTGRTSAPTTTTRPTASVPSVTRRKW